MSNITFHSAPQWQAELKHIGNEKNAVLIIDNFFPEPDILVQDASAKSFAANAPYYPGVRAAVPGRYLYTMMPALSEVLMKVFGFKTGAKPQECYYSLVTKAIKDLNTVQSLPHIDGGDDGKVALLHYLCDKTYGGTSFYRQIRTGYESVPDKKFGKYKTAVEADVKEFGMPKTGYFCESDDKFERIAQVTAKYNRAVIYLGFNLHAIDISPDFKFSSSPTEGRLTITSFLDPLAEI